MMSDWIELCLAAGFEPRRMNPLDVHFIAGRIIHDEEIHKKKRQLAILTGRVPLGSTLRFVQEMTNDERAALRERIRIP